MTKMGVVVLIFLSMFLLMAVTIRAAIVRDTDNNYVTKNGRYYIIDKYALDERGKRIVASQGPQTFAHTCPRVAVVPFDERSSYFQVQVTFTPNDYYTTIFTRHNISIKYELAKWPCPREIPPVWTVNHETVVSQSDIHFGGKPKTTLTTFMIEEEGEGYKFTHYNPQTKETYVLGALDDHDLGYKRLVLSSNQKPFIFVLEKAQVAFKRSSSILNMLPSDI